MIESTVRTPCRPVAFVRARSACHRVIERIIRIPEHLAEAAIRAPFLTRDHAGEHLLLRVAPGTPGALEPPTPSDEGDPAPEAWICATMRRGERCFRLETFWPAWADECGLEDFLLTTWETVVMFGARDGVSRDLLVEG